ncbi:hypothetical protein CALCODRAFT_493985 [Calocera cornea HHB12733]|uniref:Large ribosomal subunit protein uL30m n=1 Tax=Calocera cornea HHB12733 TaxID=1353952 RepID=A0A165HE96_9BASI|nr:hypothetical protein CALCODRAFT_493985 [Calocera cornea HHB12733]
MTDRFTRERLAKKAQAAAVPAPEASSSSGEPTHYKVTLMRSALGLPSFARETLAALGLKKRTSVVYHPFSATTAGQILRVKELVKVENVPTSAVTTREQARAMRKPSKGFEVVGRPVSLWAVEDEFATTSTSSGPEEPRQVREFVEEVRDGNPTSQASA